MSSLGSFIKLLITMLFLPFHLLLSVFNKKYRENPVILTYHAVKDNELIRFHKQMKKLTQKTKVIDLKDYGMNNKKNYSILTFDDGLESVLTNAVPVLKELNLFATIFIISGRMGQQAKCGEKMFTAEEIKALPDNIAIGSHTVNHIRLTKLSEGEIKRELTGSKLDLEGILKKPVKYFSFPYGSYNDRIIEIAKECGYERVLSNVPIVKSNKYRDFLLGRININMNDSGLEFSLKITGAYHWMAYAIELKNKIRNIIFKR
jgi:peptidoglycan/xylan/chitin deacetylase (PgdA/CDA1 family)